MDRFESIRAFTKVVEHGGFSAAARELAVSRSALSKKVIALEGALGVQLLHRNTRRVGPTEVGLAFYERCVGILEDIAAAESAVARLHEEPRGLLKVSGPVVFGTLHLAAATADYMAAYPKLRVQLTLNNRFVDPLEEDFDVAVRLGALPDSSLKARRIATARRVLCASPAYLDADGTPRTLTNLADHSCLSYGQAAPGSRWFLKGAPGQRGVSITWRLCTNNGEVLRDAALRGLGIALVPAFVVARELADGTLREVLQSHAPAPLDVHVIYPPSRHPSAKVRTFVDFLADRFGSRPDWDSESSGPTA